MTEEDDLVLDVGDDSVSENVPLSYCLRHGVIFLIDARKPMFDIDPDTGTSYFSQCLEAYKDILSEKLSWNKTDWMGIILMGTNKWDQNPEIRHVLTWQPFEEVSINQMIRIEKMLGNKQIFHDEIGSSTDYPLYDALWYAARCFNAVKIKMPFRRIILLTRSDNPCMDDSKEKYRISVKITDCRALNIQLSVVGLGTQWNPKNFWDELEVCAGNFEKAGDYERTFLADLKEEVKYASRITAKLEWSLGNGVKLGVSVSTITAKTKFPKKIRLKKENNEPLDGYSFYRKAETEYSEDEEDEDENEEADGPKIALPKNVYKCQSFGGKDIKLSMQEVYRLSNSREPGINLLGFKPQYRLDVSLHLEAPKFVTYNESEFEGSKALFAALLKRCHERNAMAICDVTLRGQSATYLYAMIPCVMHSGFFAYKLPFAENVRDFATAIPEYIYNEIDNPSPINEDTVGLCYKMIKKSTIAYDPVMFLNPKLHTELVHIESLAMDKDSSKSPDDCTIPDKNAVRERLGELRDHFEEAVRIHDKDKCIKRTGESSSDIRPKLSKMDGMVNFEELVKNQRVQTCTVKQLKDYLKSVGENPTTRKGDLVDQVYRLFD